MGGVVICAGLEVASDVSEYGEMGVLPVHAGRISFFFIWLYVFGLVCKDEGVGSRGMSEQSGRVVYAYGLNRARIVIHSGRLNKINPTNKFQII